MKNTVKLNESQLRRIITESVKSIIKEYSYDSNPPSGYECFSEIGERLAHTAISQLKQYDDIDKEALQRVLDGFVDAFKALCEVGHEDVGIKGYGIKLP